MTDDKLNEAVLEYRRKHWKVKVKKSRDSKTDIELSTTGNGYQWSTISMLPEELDRVIAALEEFRDKRRKLLKLEKEGEGL